MAQPTAPQQPSLVQMALWVLYRYRFTLAVWCAVSAVVAIIAGQKLGKETWRANSTLLYSQKPLHDGQRMVYQPPSQYTLAELLRSLEYLDAAVERSNIFMPTSVISTILEVQMPPNSEMLQLYLNWGNPQDAVQYLDALMQVAIEKRQAMRDRMIIEAEKTNQKEIVRARENFDNIDAELKKHYPTTSGLTMAQELDRLVRNIGATQMALAKAKSELNRTKLQMKEIDTYYQPLIREEMGNGTNPGLTDENRIKLDRLREQMTSQSELDELEAVLSQKRSELDIGLDLLKENAIARVEVDRMKNDVRNLETRIANKRKIKEQFDKMLKELQNDAKSPTKKMSVLEQEYRVKKGGLQIAEVGFQDELKELQTVLESQQKQNDDLTVRIREAEPIVRRLDEAKVRLQQLQSVSEVMKSQLQPDQRELSIAAKASAGFAPFANSYKKWTIAAYLLLVGSLVGGLMAWEMLKVYRGFDGLAMRLKIPILARFGPMPLSDGPELAARLMETRRLALRLCQSVPEPGSMILLASPMKGSQVEHFAAEISRCLAHHEEQVLILDMRVPDEVPRQGIYSNGHANHLAKRPGSTALLELAPMTSAVSLVQPTQMTAVDYLPIGSTERLTGVMAMTKLRQAVAQMKERYTLIFMIGPSLTGDIDTEILGAFANAVLFVTDEQAHAGVMSRTVEGLRAAQIPIVGAVLYPGEEPQVPALVLGTR